MQVSIIIPVLNEERNISHLLSRLMPVKQAGHEVIVVDGGSQDQTHTICHQFGVTLLRSEPGRSVQMAAGAHQARGDIFWFLHADTDFPFPVSDYIADLSPVCTTGGWGRFNIRFSNDRWIFKLIAHAMNLRSAMSGIATGDQGIFVSRGLYQSVGGYRLQPLMEDIQLSRDLKRLARPVALRRILVTSARRWEQCGVMRTIMLMWLLRLMYSLGVSAEKLKRYYV